jgi:hypothetical protein
MSGVRPTHHNINEENKGMMGSGVAAAGPSSGGGGGGMDNSSSTTGVASPPSPRRARRPQQYPSAPPPVSHTFSMYAYHSSPAVLPYCAILYHTYCASCQTLFIS